MELLVPLYELRPYDEADPRWSPVFFHEAITGQAGNPVVGTAQTPPANKAWIITGVYLSNSPTAAVTALNNEVRVNTATTPAARISTAFALKWPTGDLAANETVSGSQQVNLLLIGGVHALNAIWQFTAGNAANSMAWSFTGFEIPRGNVALR